MKREAHPAAHVRGETVPGCIFFFPRHRDSEARPEQVEDGAAAPVSPGEKGRVHEREKSKGSTEVQEWREMVDCTTRELAQHIGGRSGRGCG